MQITMLQVSYLLNIYQYQNLWTGKKQFYAALRHTVYDELIGSLKFQFYVIPAKAGHLVKRERYPVFSMISGLPFSRE